ncbi:hypothetical protein [Empedobacter brevis]|uniref:hypothetical protein n=1 Tax=Empedobacter brevis TaxID=247 RepID=UPI0028D82F79|nr:hypothetical protein [Empedobacter brevis]
MNSTEKNNDNQPGLICPAPECNFKMKFTMKDLLMKKEIVCPSCGLTLEMNVPVEMKKHLQEISLAEEMVKESSSFSR